MEMRVRVLYFGMLKEMVGRPGDQFDLPDGSTLGDLLDQCGRAAPPIADHREVLAYAVNLEFAQESQRLKEGDEIGMLPPVSGGAPARCSIVRDKIDTRRLLEQLKAPEDGAISVFDGIVRNNTRGRGTLYLIYEAYEEMAVKQMEALAAEALSKFAIRDARIVHRLGHLEVGDTSVYIAVASAHRAAGMDASRFLIDTLKKTVPIWKKEYFHDGAVWADGEPFPEQIRPRTTHNP